jgi:pyridoxine 5-phosphate synthase
MPASLSVNVNKIALLRNSRGRDVPDLLQAVDTCIQAGCQGITVHPRRDQRHIRYADVPTLAAHLRRHHPQIELNVECEVHPDLQALVLSVRPDQCTLVPVRPGEVTSDHGFVFPADGTLLRPVLEQLRSAGIRSSVFVDCVPGTAAGAADVGADRVELYTGPYAWAWGMPAQNEATAAVFSTAAEARESGLGINAGHDLDRHNLRGLRDLPGLDEVSIGHAVICRALEVGLTTSVRELLSALGR